MASTNPLKIADSNISSDQDILVSVGALECVELDYALYSVTEAEQSQIRKSLKKNPRLDTDILREGYFEREFKLGSDANVLRVVFSTIRQNSKFDVTIVGARPPIEPPSGQRAQKAIEMIATIRGAIGL